MPPWSSGRRICSTARTRHRGGSACCATPGSPACPRRAVWSPGDRPDGAETLVASVDEYLPGAVDGWTWAVDLITAAARDRQPGSVRWPRPPTSASSSPSCMPRWRAPPPSPRARTRPGGVTPRSTTLETVCALPDSDKRRDRARAPRRARGHPRRARRARGHPGHRGARRSARGSGAAQRRTASW